MAIHVATHANRKKNNSLTHSWVMQCLPTQSAKATTMIFLCLLNHVRFASNVSTVFFANYRPQLWNGTSWGIAACPATVAHYWDFHRKSCMQLSLLKRNFGRQWNKNWRLNWAVLSWPRSLVPPFYHLYLLHLFFHEWMAIHRCVARWLTFVHRLALITQNVDNWVSDTPTRLKGFQ